ncbi:endonuclease/exonuclease/phosphatase family protein [Streptomyces sp. NBC_01197]|uniref:endonuclease/exonuclease/phosphatase family protein n=1 Tax=Streptomyces sp. NBC_01197 TaxID=2903768 RepID=UPI002E14D820|nr:endonuclease/exonuclease/phosphatase family protein [Streptomyces sp. NBC_01197]
MTGYLSAGGGPTADSRPSVGPQRPSDTDRPGPVRRAAQLLGRVRWLWAATWLWLAVALVHLVLSGRWWLMLVPDLAPPLVYAAVPLLLVAAAVAGRLRRTAPPRRVTWTTVAGAVAALVLGWNSCGAQWGVLFHDSPSGTPDLRVVSWNTRFWAGDTDRAVFYRTIRERRADVYLLQEYITTHDNGATAEPIDELAQLRANFPGYHIVVRGELVTLSRLPVVSAHSIGPGAGVEHGQPPWQTEFDKEKVLRTDVRVGGHTVSLYNVHVPVQINMGVSPLGSRLYRMMHANERARKAQFEGLADDLRANALPTVVAGDFNTSPAMGDLHTLRGRMRDAADAGDSLFPASWGHLWRLDWAFLSGSIAADHYRIDPMGGISDHRAQIMSFTL